MRLWRWLGGGFRRAEKPMTGRARAARDDPALLVLLARSPATTSWGRSRSRCPARPTTARTTRRTAHDAALDEAVALIPDGRQVSANNNAGAQLAARRVAYVFPYFADADWVLVDERHPFFYDKEDEQMHPLALGRPGARHRFQSVFAKDGVLRLQAGRRTRGRSGRRPPARPARLRTHVVRDAQATQLNDANLAVSATSSTSPTTTTALCARGRSRVYSARAT